MIKQIIKANDYLWIPGNLSGNNAMFATETKEEGGNSGHSDRAEASCH